MPSVYLVKVHNYDDVSGDWDEFISDEEPVFSMPSAAEARVEKLNQMELETQHKIYVQNVEYRNSMYAPRRAALEAAKATGNEVLIAAVSPAPDEVKPMSVEEYRDSQYEDDKTFYYTVATLEFI